MNFFYSFVLIFTFLSLAQAYKYYRNEETTTEKYSDYCILGSTTVCGTNGHEYFRLDNECEFNNFNSLQLENGQNVLSKTLVENCYPSYSSGAFDPSNYNRYCPQYCNRIFKPVCASYQNVQRNFTNECELKKYICDTKTNWQIVLNGTCVAASPALNDQQVCASYYNYTQVFPNLLSLYNNIQATGKSWEIINMGPCPCPTEYRPICAQLNYITMTFQNECFLERETNNGSYWSILFFGECPELPTTAAANTTSAASTTTSATTPADVSTSANDASSGDTSDTGGTEATTVGSPGAGNPATTTTTTTAAPANNSSNNSNVIYGDNTGINNKPVYIVRKNKITPYIPPHPGYNEKMKPPASQTYYPSYNPSKAAYGGSNNPSASYRGSHNPSSSNGDSNNPSASYSGSDRPTNAKPSSTYSSSYTPTNAKPSSTYNNPSLSYRDSNNPSASCGGSDRPTNTKPSSTYSSSHTPTNAKPSFTYNNPSLSYRDSNNPSASSSRSDRPTNAKLSFTYSSSYTPTNAKPSSTYSSGSIKSLYNISPPEYGIPSQSNYKPANSESSAYNSGNYPVQSSSSYKSSSNSKYNTKYTSDYNPVAIQSSYYKVSQIDHGVVRYDEDELLDRIYESFT